MKTLWVSIAKPIVIKKGNVDLVDIQCNVIPMQVVVKAPRGKFCKNHTTSSTFANQEIRAFG
jgi:hypothetical protein